MTVGTLSLEIVFPGCRSLKQKRAVVKSIISRTRNKFNVSIAETGAAGSSSRGNITIAAVSNERRHLNSMLDKALVFVESLRLADITDVSLEIF
ncbi:MAG: DUF503 family protein [Candidatus Omnitrophica bacterium]|nr:DUF503 family protein [Candidatus Omnitrophota bacterium]